MFDRRLILIGIDSLIPSFVHRFVEAGYMPNMADLLKTGAETEVIPTFPPWTPPGWATIGTGAWPSTHGIEGFGVHIPGEPLDAPRDGFDSRLCRAQYLWEAVEQEGGRALLLKYPGSWPHRMKESVQVAGEAGFAGRYGALNLSHPACYTTDPEVEQAVQITLKPADNWAAVPESDARPLEFTLPVKLRYSGEVREYFGLVTAENGSGYNTFYFCRSRRVDTQLTRVEAGKWSPWLSDLFPGPHGETTGYFRLRVVRLTSDGRSVQVYLSQNHSNVGHTTPAHVGPELLRAVGPMVEHCEVWDRNLGWTDDQAQFEIFADHADWLVAAGSYTMDHYPWDVFATQYHPVDTAQHLYFGGIDPEHPHYDSSREAYYWDLLGQAYGLADRLIGMAMRKADERTVVAVVGDHGHMPKRSILHMNNLLARAGYLALTRGSNGGYEVDWANTRAYAAGPVHIYINLMGRDPAGIVSPGDEYRRLQGELIEMLHGVRHEPTGRHVVRQAFRRDEANAFGLYGDGIGDVLYCVEEGFDSGASMRVRSLDDKYTDQLDLFEETRLIKDASSQHCSAFPWAPLIRTYFAVSGPDVRAGYRRRNPIQLVDVCPTLAIAARLPMPRNVEGCVARDLMK